MDTVNNGMGDFVLNSPQLVFSIVVLQSTEVSVFGFRKKITLITEVTETLLPVIHGGHTIAYTSPGQTQN